MIAHSNGASSKRTLSFDPARYCCSRKRWRLGSSAPAALIEAMKTVGDIPGTILPDLLYQRGIESAEDARVFLARWSEERDPFLFADMDKAVERLKQAIIEQSDIVIYGDYDADGVTATAVLIEAIRTLGGRVRAYIPHREREGYGVNADALSHLAAEGAELVVTVDCGIRAGAEIEVATERGVDVIVTDHHALPENLPSAFAVINPKREDCRYAEESLAGVGLAYKLAEALLIAESLDHDGGESRLMHAESLLDLVAIGTVADVVPLKGENRSLVHRGVDILRQTRRPGLDALIEASKREKRRLSSRDIGFALGPRINAAGRMDDAQLALDLCLAERQDEARGLAGALEAYNLQRREVMTEARRSASARIADFEEMPFFILDTNHDMPIGVVGLVAGRLADQFHRPAAVVRIDGDTARGSARSIPEFNMVSALDECEHLMIRYGGHAMAAGFTILTENLKALGQHLERIATERLSDQELRPEIEVAAELREDHIDWDLWSELERLEPFGAGNPEPQFLLRNAIIGNRRRVGSDGAHLKLSIERASGRGTLDAIGFGFGDAFDLIQQRLDIVFTLGVNEWRGRRSLQLMISDLADAEVQTRLEPCLRFENAEDAKPKPIG